MTDSPLPSGPQAEPDSSSTSPLEIYAHAVKAGPLLFVSGLGARSAESGKEVGLTLNENGGILSYDMAAQTRQTLENLTALLKKYDCTLQDVVDVTVFLAHMDDYAVFNEVYREFFNFDPAPARTTIQATPPGRNFIELKAIAYQP